MSTITFDTVTTTNTTALAAAIERAAAPALEQLGERMGQEGTREIAARFRAKYPRPRPPARRRGSSPIGSEGNYSYEVVRSGDSVAVEWFIVGGDDFKVKFFSLNNGSRGHTIAARGGPKARLAYNRSDPASTDYDTFPHRVRHPGTSGSHVYEEAIEAVLARYR